MQLGPVLFREGHVGEHILFGIIHDGGELRHFRPDLVGDVAPLAARCLRCILSKGGGDESGHDAAAAFSGMRQHVSHEVDPGAVEEPIVGGAMRKPPTSRFQKLFLA